MAAAPALHRGVRQQIYMTTIMITIVTAVLAADVHEDMTE
jgi:hypothetical protein